MMKIEMPFWYIQKMLVNAGQKIKINAGITLSNSYQIHFKFVG